MTIFEAIYRFIQAVWQALLDLIQPLIMPDWGWVISVILPLGVAALVALYFVYLFVRYQRSAAANVDRRPRRLATRPTPPPGLHVPGPSWWPIALSAGFFLALLGLAVWQTVLLAIGLVVTLAGGWGWLRSANREWRRAELGAGHEPAAPMLKARTGAAALVPPTRALVPRGPTAVMGVSAGPAGYAAAHEPEPPAGVHMPAPSWWPVYASAAAFFALLGLAVNLALLAGGLVLALLAFAGWYRDAYRELKVAEGIAPRPHVRDPLAVFPKILAAIGMAAVIGSIAFAVGPSLIARYFPAAGGAPAGGGTAACTPPKTIEVTAKDTAFDTKELCLPANVPFQIVFHNEDQGIQHNISIGSVFNGKVIEGVATVTDDVPALPPGTYHFICVVHPTIMFGTATVVPVGSGGPGGPGGSPGSSPPVPGGSASPAASS